MLRRKPSKEGLLVSIFAHTGKLLWFQPHHLTNGYEAQFVRASKSMQDVSVQIPEQINYKEVLYDETYK